MTSSSKTLALAATLVALGGLACGGGSGTGPSPTPSKRSGTINDAAGDAVAFGGAVQPVPDLTGVTIEFGSATVTVTASFAPGTFVPEDMYLSLFLDTDHNPFTGGLMKDGMLGTEYWLRLGYPRGSMKAAIWKDSPSTLMGEVAVTLPTPDQVRVEFPRDWIGGAYGPIRFKMISGEWTGDRSGVDELDYAPDLGVLPGEVL